MWTSRESAFVGKSCHQGRTTSHHSFRAISPDGPVAPAFSNHRKAVAHHSSVITQTNRARVTGNPEVIPWMPALMCLLFLPEQTEELLRALYRQRHEVGVVLFLIAGNRQQRALRCDREPAVIHSNQELNCLPR